MTHLLPVLLLATQAGPWTAPVEVTHDDQRAAAYRARLDGEYLQVEVALEPGWHTFSLDNAKRAEEKLAGKKSLGQDRPTEIKVSGGLEAAGPWLQPEPKDFSKPELRWFSWGFEGKALFAVKVKRVPGPGPAQLDVRAQACTESVCKNVHVGIALPLPARLASGGDVKGLVAVR